MKPIYQMDISFLTLPHFYFVWFSFEKDFSDRENAPRPKIFFFFFFFLFLFCFSQFRLRRGGVQSGAETLASVCV